MTDTNDTKSPRLVANNGTPDWAIKRIDQTQTLKAVLEAADEARERLVYFLAWTGPGLEENAEDLTVVCWALRHVEVIRDQCTKAIEKAGKVAS
jgi:hypothetical protein